MIELDDAATKADIWAMKAAAMDNVVPEVTQLDSTLSHVTCLICERRWVGSGDELTDFLEGHEHDLALHIEWFLATHHGWPPVFVDLIRQLLEGEFVGRRRFLELREKLDAGRRRK